MLKFGERTLEAIYGVTELARDAFACARLIADPGCYAITAILAVAPALRRKLFDPISEIDVVAVTDTTGAGGASRRETSPVAAFDGSNYCLIGLDTGPQKQRIKIAATADKLVKGAAGTAIQNLNLLFGLPDEAGLLNFGL